MVFATFPVRIQANIPTKADPRKSRRAEYRQPRSGESRAETAKATEKQTRLTSKKPAAVFLGNFRRRRNAVRFNICAGAKKAAAECAHNAPSCRGPLKNNKAVGDRAPTPTLL